MKSRGQDRRQFWLGMLLSLGSLALLFYFVPPTEFLPALARARPGYLLLGTLGVLIFLLVRSVRWRFMLRNRVSWPQVFHIQNIGYMLNAVAPLRLGDVGRSVLIGRIRPVTTLEGLSTTVVERLLDMLVIVALLPLTAPEVNSLPVWVRDGARFSGLVAFLAIGALLLAVRLRNLIHRSLTRLVEKTGVASVGPVISRTDQLLNSLENLARPKDALILVGMSLTTWMPIVFAYFITLRAVNIDATWALAGFLVSASALTVAIPSSPGQIGIFHAGVTLALAAAGQPAAESLSFAILYHGINNMGLMIIAGIVGINRTGATFGQVIEVARRFISRQKATATGGDEEIDGSDWR